MGASPTAALVGFLSIRVASRLRAQPVERPILQMDGRRRSGCTAAQVARALSKIFPRRLKT
jgi:hypothetical protein